VDYRPHGVRVTVVNEVPAEVVAPVVPAAAAAAAPGLQTLDAGYGLTGMHERLRLLRGSLDAGVRDGRWVVRAELPVAAGSSAPETASISTTGNADR
jgi:glucose-6-phosphate-specific signal transduction histidine kinase